ncbi:hypothetical protein ACIBG4_40680 [Nonomuraea sp. NPDC050383]|uniref:hypothetical protein n=1 Tax=Nonomuraea sp. NPDC050383 TaxID=3364362 RepID=UPI0037AC059A
MTSSGWARVQLGLAVTWMLLIAPTLIWWRDSVLWVALMSLWANIAAHLAAWQAARTERKLDAGGAK